MRTAWRAGKMPTWRLSVYGRIGRLEVAFVEAAKIYQSTYCDRFVAFVNSLSNYRTHCSIFSTVSESSVRLTDYPPNWFVEGRKKNSTWVIPLAGMFGNSFETNETVRRVRKLATALLSLLPTRNDYRPIIGHSVATGSSLVALRRPIDAIIRVKWTRRGYDTLTARRCHVHALRRSTDISRSELSPASRPRSSVFVFIYSLSVERRLHFFFLQPLLLFVVCSLVRCWSVPLDRTLLVALHSYGYYFYPARCNR